ncbi:MAG: alkaline phosphatase [Candidatus Doudnabacteria bacterium RIFCSPHIGHO2_02_FULL_46_11]|uniref:Alkaline phosphatase n=1 Tax=Candidatus Doudnabacteria bacterium RIFCSPHIGHO2_02_FULL_46_11 TaxID=1817832 RepID=A0A1F5P8S1_9BACT|nr:MAG: alkaline phosphatase [Candidatus Doudnabacteria bacterium RIFCSPHIGHO2_02_FULL_46_11]
MLETILSPIINFVTNTISAAGYIGIAVLMAIESAAIPLPSEIIMPFAGFLVHEGRFTLFGAALSGAIGSVLGSWVIYFIALKGGRPLVERYGHYVFISKSDLDKADGFFKKYGAWSTFIGRMLPIVRTYISVPAGIAKTPFWSFTLAAFVGSFIWSYILAFLGMKLGAHWESLHEQLRGFDVAIAILIVLSLVWYIWRHIRVN